MQKYSVFLYNDDGPFIVEVQAESAAGAQAELLLPERQMAFNSPSAVLAVFEHDAVYGGCASFYACSDARTLPLH